MKRGKAVVCVALELRLRPVPPFDFDLSASIFSESDGQICRYEGGRFWQVIRLDGKLVLVVIRAFGTVEDPELLVELKSDGEISGSDGRKAEDVVNMLFNLKVDLNAFYKEARNDRVMVRLVQSLEV